MCVILSHEGVVCESFSMRGSRDIYMGALLIARVYSRLVWSIEAGSLELLLLLLLLLLLTVH